MKKVLVAVAILIVAAFVVWGMFKPVAIVAPVTTGQAVKIVPGSVTIQPEFQMELRSEVAGRLIKNELDPGTPVKEGQVVAQLDTADLFLDIEETQNKYDAAKKGYAVGSSIKLKLETAHEKLDNFERQAKAGNYPLAELEQQRRLVKQTEQELALEDVARQSEIATYDNTLKVKHRQLEKMTIIAPFDGVVSAVYARKGDLVSANASIATLISTGRTVEGKISQEDFANIRLGQRATVRFLGRDDDNYEATVSKILPTAEADTQRCLIHLAVKCPADVMVPGLTGEVNVVVATRAAQALIFRRALFGDHVFVVEDGRVHLRKVEVGYVSLNIVEITKGLRVGESVIVEDLDKFRDGDRVDPKQVTK